MKHLFCIFNANDPTPTAYALRSSTYDKVTVFVIGQERFGERQERALYRFKKWLSGSAKSSEDWPQGLWKDAWDWKKPEDSQTISLRERYVVGATRPWENRIHDPMFDIINWGFVKR